MIKQAMRLSIKFIVVLLLSTVIAHAQLNTTPIVSKETACLITGEQSGEELAAWFLSTTKIHTTYEVHALASDQLLNKFPIANLGDYNDLRDINILNGAWNLFSQVVLQQSTYNRLVRQIVKLNPKKLILIDLPWVNLRLARSVKKILPRTHITFIAPPELWFWGCWGIDKLLKDYCDECIVLYPHEQVWYTTKGIRTTWLGYPYIEEFRSFIEHPRKLKPCLALLPGSRTFEVAKSLPLFCQALKQCSTLGQFEVVVVQANSIEAEQLSQIITQYELQDLVTIIPQADRTRLSSCFYALTKPGTVTLQLALLGIPHAVVFKSSWLSNFIMSHMIKPKAFGLPNLLSEAEVSDEFIQNAATPANLAAHIDAVFSSFKNEAESYKLRRQKVSQFAKAFLEHDKKN
jgi:lipid-A-disaccharide synthase